MMCLVTALRGRVHSLPFCHHSTPGPFCFGALEHRRAAEWSGIIPFGGDWDRVIARSGTDFGPRDCGGVATQAPPFIAGWRRFTPLIQKPSPVRRLVPVNIMGSLYIPRSIHSFVGPHLSTTCSRLSA